MGRYFIRLGDDFIPLEDWDTKDYFVAQYDGHTGQVHTTRCGSERKQSIAMTVFTRLLEIYNDSDSMVISSLSNTHVVVSRIVPICEFVTREDSSNGRA